MVQDLSMAPVMQLSDYTTRDTLLNLWSHPGPCSRVENLTWEAGKALCCTKNLFQERDVILPLRTAQMEIPQMYLSTGGVSIDPQNTGKRAREED